MLKMPPQPPVLSQIKILPQFSKALFLGMFLFGIQSKAAQIQLNDIEAMKLVYFLKDSGISATFFAGNDNDYYLSQALVCTSTTGIGAGEGRICFAQVDNKVLQVNSSENLYNFLTKFQGLETCDKSGIVSVCRIKLKSVSCFGRSGQTDENERYTCQLSIMD